MRAVNLVPMDSRRGAGAPTRSGGLAYGVVGALAVMAVMALLYSLSARQLNTQEAELARLKAENASATASAAALAPYQKFATTSKDRQETVSQIAAERFDWGQSMRELARVLPKSVDLVSIDGAKSGGTATPAAGATATAAATEITLTGCAASQADVARLLARLRAIKGVDRVALTSSAKADAAGSSDGDCRAGKAEKPQFSLKIVFRAPASAATPAAGATPAASTGATAAPSTPSTGTPDPSAPQSGAPQGGAS